jgi:hypothetical protein
MRKSKNERAEKCADAKMSSSKNENAEKSPRAKIDLTKNRKWGKPKAQGRSRAGASRLGYHK